MSSWEGRIISAIVIALPLALLAYPIWLFKRDPRIALINQSGSSLTGIVVVSRAELRRVPDLPSGEGAILAIGTEDSDPILVYYHVAGVMRVADGGLMDRGETRKITILPPGDHYLLTFGPATLTPARLGDPMTSHEESPTATAVEKR